MSFPRYYEYKDSGVEWLGEAPAHWETMRLRHVTALNPSKSEIAAVPPDAELSFLPMEAVGDDGSLDLSRTRPLAEVASGYTYFREGDVVIAKITPCFENGKGAIMRDLTGGHGFGTTELIVCRPKPGHTSSDYLHWIFISAPFRKLGEGAMYGAGGQKRVPDDFVRDFAIAFPPLPEQTAIATFLDRETAKIDELVAEQECVLELITEKITALAMSSINSPHAKKLRLEHAADVISRPVSQVRGEEYEPLGLYNRARGIFHKNPRAMADMGDSDFFWIKKGDLILSGQFAWEGALGLAREAEEGCVVSHRYPVLRGRDGVANTEYLFAFLATKHGDFLLNECSRGSAGRNRPLNLRDLLKQKISIPGPERQNEIKKLVHARAELLEMTKKQITLLQERRTALISAAVTGKIDVRNVVARMEEVTA